MYSGPSLSDVVFGYFFYIGLFSVRPYLDNDTNMKNKLNQTCKKGIQALIKNDII